MTFPSSDEKGGGGRETFPYIFMSRGKERVCIDDRFIDNYQLLANAIVQQACLDYRQGRLVDSLFKRFLFSDWYKLLTNVDGEYIYQRLRKERMDNGKSKKRSYRKTAKGGA